MRLLRLSRRSLVLVVLATVFASPIASAASGGEGVDLLPVLLALVVILVAGKLGGEAFAALGQPPVLGELLAGVAIGNLRLLGFQGFEGFTTSPAIDLLAQIGVLFLLFAVGLESDVSKMIAVGASSIRVAVLGVVAPLVLGWGCSRLFFPALHPLTHWFVGATLTATSVGITARVLADLKRMSSLEGQIVLGAAVIDDVLGLIVLAVVSGIIQAADQGRAFDATMILWIVAKSVAFLGGAVLLGRQVSKHTFRLAARFRSAGVLLSFAIAFCFGLAWLAGASGLAPIVGAFAAGLVLDEVHTRDATAKDPHQRSVEQLLEPLTTFLVPVFFVLMGMRVDLAALGNPTVLGFAMVLSLAAIAGKQVCSLGVTEKGVDRLAVGFGMIPRGEVGLIFASIGAALTIGGVRVIDGAVYAAVVLMVAATTLVTPPLLAWRLRR